MPPPTPGITNQQNRRLGGRSAPYQGSGLTGFIHGCSYKRTLRGALSNSVRASHHLGIKHPELLAREGATRTMYFPTALFTTLIACVVSARQIPLKSNMKSLGLGVQDEDDEEDGCPSPNTSYCCYKLDYTCDQVECIGPGKVDSFEECRDYDPRPMCCCGFPGLPGMPWLPAEMSCDKECYALKDKHREM
ncbi:hypothetical protein B0T16DRAFT_184675 [Cercophora newfieldiana]|uniref:Uncharacterized protein n=1 Tax=Cercophora newfieldiana TaxID=92897 RepID=A0AA39Y062_9PEZI|nr:hypothetical protein B0T16DRAFT_184675 [Cercophora newfieldiana]